MWGGKIEALAGWRWAFFTVVPPGILLGLLAIMRKDPRATVSRPRLQAGKGAGEGVAKVLAYETPQPPHRASMRDYLSLLRNRSYMLDCAGMTAMTFAIGGIAFWMPHYIAEYRNAGTLEHVNFVFGALTAIAGVTATLAGGLTGDALRSRFPGSYFLVSGVAIFISCPFVILMLYSPFPLAWVWAFIAMFFLFFNTGPSNTILANVTHRSIRSTAFAMNIFLIHALGDAISPPLLGAIVGKQERWNAAFYVVAAVMAIAGVLWLWGARYLHADTLAAETAGAASTASAPRQIG
jgi:MFS family permease